MNHTQHIEDFTRKVQDHCAPRGIGHQTLTNRVLGQTYALKRMLALAKSLDDRIARLNAAMESAIPTPLQPPPVQIDIDLPVSTSTNRMKALGKAGQFFRSRDYRAWRNAAGMQIIQDRAFWVKKSLPPDHPYTATIRISTDDQADVDNRIKALLDLLVEMQVTPDDRYLHHVSCGRSDDVPQGRILVTLRSVPFEMQG